MIPRPTLRSTVFSALLAVSVALVPQMLCAATTAEQAQPSAQAILHKAEAEARAEHKNILVEFGASWCVNCHLYEHMLENSQIHNILGRYFVFVPMDTGEMPADSRHHNTPGGKSFEATVGGKGAGWPYIVVLNDRGRPLIDSMSPDTKAPGGRTNIGYPVLPVEVDWFMTMLHRGAPAMTKAESAQVRAWLTAQANKILHG